MKDKKMLLGIGIVFLFLASTGFSYAYFTSTLVNKDVKEQVVTTGTLELTYTDGSEVIMQNVWPGAVITKTIYVKNTGTFDTNFNLIWQKYKNEVLKDEMLVEATCEMYDSNGERNLGDCDGLLATPVTGNTILNNISIPKERIFKYTINFIFNEISADQNYNQGKSFSGVLGIEESNGYDFTTDSWDTIMYNIRSGNERYYRVGSTRKIELGNYGTHTIRVANNTNPDECNSNTFSETACGFVLEFTDIITSAPMNSSNTNKGVYPSGEAYSKLTGEIYNEMPEEIKTNIIDTRVVSSYSPANTENFITNDKLYLLSPVEVYGKDDFLNDTAVDLTRQLDFYKKNNVDGKNSESAIKTSGESNDSWWLRSPMTTNTMGYYNVRSSGSNGTSLAVTSDGISPAFRIG